MGSQIVAELRGPGLGLPSLGFLFGLLLAAALRGAEHAAALRADRNAFAGIAHDRADHVHGLSCGQGDIAPNPGRGS
ncbi:hypothetical protein ABZN20_17085 [Methylococcus sp. ANG]|uniref:hypothetical protein n=1 Tax=unclassified Methylococcus TaxID=2618889 RepID=UPI001C52941B|nr:hypothetical protein [Methylococcus sp. Mc7]QXP82589.1 hypothetical protein KW115_10045 [Methylococcus sp. Mc7]